MLEYAGRFSDPKLVIKQGNYWSIVYRESTVTLGNCVLICNRECPNMGELKIEEIAEFPIMCKWFENKIKSLYGAVKFNYLALMMREEFVHFHLIPRYDKDIEKYGIVWKDIGWPSSINLNRIEIPSEVKEQIIKDLKD